MAEDAITDEVCDLNPFKGIRIAPTIREGSEKPRPIRVFSSEDTLRGRYEAMVRVFTDTGLRLGEVLPLRREDFDGETLQVRRTAHEGRILEGTKTDHGEPDAGRVVPVPATLAWMLEAQISFNGPDCQLLFPTPRGRLWRECTFYRDLWKPAQEASGLDIRPHECRHSYVTHLRAAGVNDADLAEMPVTALRRCWRGIRMPLARALRRFAALSGSSLNAPRVSLLPINGTPAKDPERLRELSGQPSCRVHALSVRHWRCHETYAGAYSKLQERRGLWLGRVRRRHVSCWKERGGQDRVSSSPSSTQSNAWRDHLR
jgi:Phage integrase family